MSDTTKVSLALLVAAAEGTSGHAIDHALGKPEGWFSKTKNRIVRGRAIEIEDVEAIERLLDKPLREKIE